MGDEGGDCRKQRVTYTIICTTYQKERKARSNEAANEGETGRNAYNRGKEHLADFRKKSEDSIMWQHCLHHHQGREDITFCMKDKRAYKEPLDRQLGEKVDICKF